VVLVFYLVLWNGDGTFLARFLNYLVFARTTKAFLLKVETFHLGDHCQPKRNVVYEM
jgi:hypothetical protein